MIPTTPLPIEPWFHNHILQGLQTLLCLGLEGQPAAEVLPGTALAWEAAIWPGRAWSEERDAERMEQAFRTLIRTCRRWPVPAQFFEVFPRYEFFIPALPKPCDDTVPQRELRRMADILKETLPETLTQPAQAP